MTEQEAVAIPPTARSKDSTTMLALRAARLLAQRYETDQHKNIEQAMQIPPSSHEYRAALDRVTIDLLSLARRELSVRLAANDQLMHQDVGVLLARTTLAASAFGRVIVGSGRPRSPSWEALVAVLTVAYVHEHASTTNGAAKLREEIDYVWGTLFDQGGQPS